MSVTVPSLKPRSKNRFRVVVEVIVDADSREAAEEEVLSKFAMHREQVSILEVDEEEAPVQLADTPDYDEEIEPTFTVVVEFTVEEAKHLYNLMRVVYTNLQNDPDYSPMMAEARTVSKVIDALDESMGDIIHVL